MGVVMVALMRMQIINVSWAKFTADQLIFMYQTIVFEHSQEMPNE